MRLMHRRSLFASLVLVLVFVVGAGGALPEPLRQHAPWAPLPISGAAHYLPELVAMLFDAGLADPRGGEYRQIELTLSPGQDHAVTTHGWYFPQGFAVCWDGLAHRVAHAGNRADLSGDVATARVKFWREGTISTPPDAELVGVALLLRLNEAELARLLLARVPILPAPRFGATESERQHLDRLNWFEVAGVSWLSGGFHQAVVAHAASDDRLAIDIAESLMRARPAFEAAWKGLGPALGSDNASPVVFLDPVPALLADSGRRLKEPPQSKFDPVLLRGMAPSKRIAALIERLEDVEVQQFSQPGGAWIMGSPICKMLAAEGVDAIDPLLDVLDHDQRLTRSYSFGRNFFPHRHLISVSEAAEAVLKNYYQLDVLRWQDRAERRAWLVRNKYRTLAERSLDLLAGDLNDEIQWLDAARTLLQVTRQGLGFIGKGVKVQSVSNLLAERATEMKTNWADDMGLLLYEWDPPASLPTLQKLAHRSYMQAQDGRGLPRLVCNLATRRRHGTGPRRSKAIRSYPWIN
jgi:hypothetical protein